MTVLPSTLTLGVAPLALEGLKADFDAGTGPVWTIDAAPVARLDTSALAVLLECARMAAAGGRRLEITGVPPRLAELAKLYGVEQLLGLEGGPDSPPLPERPAGAAYSGAT